MIETNFKHTDIGPIPHDWEVMPLSKIGTFFRGHGIVRKDSNSGNISALRYGEIYTTHHNYVKEYVSHISREVANDSFRLKIGDICFAGYGETLQDIGKAVAITKEEEAYAGQNIVVLRPSKRISAIYFGYMLNMPNIAIQKANRGNGSSIMLITPKALSEILTPIPESEDEQMRIGKALSDIDELIGGLRKLIEKKRNIKKGAMSRLLSGSLRLPGFNKPWETNLLGDLGIFIKGKGISRDESNSGSIPAIRYGEIYTYHSDYIKKFRSHISQKVAETSQSLKYGDICFAASGETLDDIGKAVAFVDDFEAYAGGDIVIFRPQKEINPIFFGFLLNTPSVVLQKSLKGHGLSIMHIRAASLAELVINYPTDIAEQEAIAKVLTDMDAEIEKLEKKLAKYEQVKQGMMKQLLTGKIRLI